MRGKRILSGVIAACALALFGTLVFSVQEGGRSREATSGSAQNSDSPFGEHPVGSGESHEATRLEITELPSPGEEASGSTSIMVGALQADQEEWAEGTEIQIEHTSAEGELITLLSDRGRTFIEERITDVDGHVRLSLGDVTLTTEHARYETEGDMVHSDAALEIAGPGWKLAGRGFEAELGSQRVRVLHDVVTWIEPAATAPDGDG